MTRTACFAALCLTSTALTQSPAEAIAASVRPATWSAAGLAGDGGVFLLHEAEGAEFVVLGESHGNVETCRLAAWLLRELKDDGFGAFATETGPCTTEHVTAVARAGGAEAVESWVLENRFSIAFLHMREEAALFAEAVALGYATWGLDQEFMGSPRFLLGQLADRAKGPEARELAGQWRRRALEGFAHYARTGDRSKAFLAIADAEAWKNLDIAFAGEDVALRQILGELRETQRVYGLYHQGRYYENNRARIDLMKAHLVARLTAAPGAKAILKFGSAHAGRGYSPFDQLDVGNHVAERAVARGGASLHVLVAARRSIGADGEVRDRSGEGSVFAPFLAVEPVEGAAQVFDLRALRPALHGAKDRAATGDLRDLALRFDLLVMLPEFHASTMLHPVPGG